MMEFTDKTYTTRFNAQRAARTAGIADTWIERRGPKQFVIPAAAFKAQAKPVYRGKYVAMAEAAERGVMPTPPDFSAPTHSRYRTRLANLVALAQSGDLDGLREFRINPISSSPKALKRYRDMAVTALEAKVAGP